MALLNTVPLPGCEVPGRWKEDAANWPGTKNWYRIQGSAENAQRTRSPSENGLAKQIGRNLL